MPRHLWQRHGRLLAGKRVRSPMSWLNQWAANSNPHADPDDAIAAFYRFMRRDLHRGPEAESALRAVAARRGSALCPHCWAMAILPPIDYPDPAALQPLESSARRLSGEGYSIFAVQRGARMDVRIDSPNVKNEDTRYSLGPWDRSVATRRFVAPMVCLAVIIALLLPPNWAVLGVLTMLSLALFVDVVIRTFTCSTATDVLIDTAWSHLAPSLLPSSVHAQDARFLGRLARSSVGRGDPSKRASHLTGVLHAIEEATAPQETTVWASLKALSICDLAERDGADPVRALAASMGDAISRGEPLARIETLLAYIPWRDWPIGRRSRLHAAVIDQCFHLGLGVWELVELGETVPRLGALLRIEVVDELAVMHRIWAIRHERPWDSLGPAATVFDLAAFPWPGDEVLANAPDTLLYQPLPSIEPGEPRTDLVATSRGLHFRGAILHSPTPIEVSRRRFRRGFTLHFGPHRFCYEHDPSELAKRLSAWSEFLFQELLGRSSSALTPPDGARLESLLRSKTLSCPRCRLLFRGRRTNYDGSNRSL
jgi:hypothetical protein